MHRDHVGAALGDDHAAGARGVRARDVGAEEVPAAVVDRVIGRVQVPRLLPFPHRPRAEAEHAPARVAEREHDPSAEAVVRASLTARAGGQASGDKLAVGEPGAPRGEQHAVPSARCVADAELAKNTLLEPARGQVRSRRVGLLGLPQHAHVPRRRALEELEQPVARPPALGRRRVLLDDLELHPVAVGQELERALELQPLGELHELEGVAALATADAIEELLRRIDAERRRALAVQRAQPLVTGRPHAAQLHARADKVDHVDRGAHALLGVVGVAGHGLHRKGLGHRERFEGADAVAIGHVGQAHANRARVVKDDKPAPGRTASKRPGAPPGPPGGEPRSWRAQPPGSAG